MISLHGKLTLKSAGAVASKIQHHREEVSSLHSECRWGTERRDESECSEHDLLSWFTPDSSLHEWCIFISSVQRSVKNKHSLDSSLISDDPWCNLSNGRLTPLKSCHSDYKNSLHEDEELYGARAICKKEGIWCKHRWRIKITTHLTRIAHERHISRGGWGSNSLRNTRSRLPAPLCMTLCTVSGTSWCCTVGNWTSVSWRSFSSHPRGFLSSD